MFKRVEKKQISLELLCNETGSERQIGKRRERWMDKVEKMQENSRD